MLFCVCFQSVGGTLVQAAQRWVLGWSGLEGAGQRPIICFTNTQQPAAARGRKAALSETLLAVVAHRGPVVETSNQPTDQHKKLDESISQHYFQRKTVSAQNRPLYGSITHGP